MKQREPRRKVMIRAQMRSDGPWSDVSIHNMSSRGLLATSLEICRPGTVVEIRRTDHIIVGRVVWQNGTYFGVRTQDRIDVDRIIAARPPVCDAEHTGDSALNGRGPQRLPSAGEREAASRRFGARFQFVALVLAVGFLSLVAAQAVSHALSRPFDAIRAQLDRH